MLFSSQDDDAIKQFMSEHPNHPKPFKALSEILLGRYTTKQIRDRWINKLDPRYDHSDFSFYEKLYIDIWVVENSGNCQDDSNILWRSCQEAMREGFGKLYSCGKIKNYYYSNRRRLARRQLQARISA